MTFTKATTQQNDDLTTVKAGDLVLIDGHGWNIIMSPDKENAPHVDRRRIKTITRLQKLRLHTDSDTCRDKYVNAYVIIYQRNLGKIFAESVDAL